MNRSKAIGTAAESAVVKAARTRGFPHAERVVLHGNLDQGDVRLTPGLTAGVIVEVKGGHAAENASDGQVAKWLTETQAERIHANADHALLVTKRKGIGHENAHRWSAWLTLWDFRRLIGWPWVYGGEHVNAFPIHLTFDSALALLRAAGYGDPIEKES